MRAVFGQIIAEKNKLKAENRILKQTTQLTIDMRPNSIKRTYQSDDKVEILPALHNVLLNADIEALKDAIDEVKIQQRGWTVTKYGAIKDENDRPLFKNGFVLAIQKVLSQV